MNQDKHVKMNIVAMATIVDDDSSMAFVSMKKTTSKVFTSKYRHQSSCSMFNTITLDCEINRGVSFTLFFTSKLRKTTASKVA